MKVMVIINPRAGKMRSKTALYDITEALCLAGHEPTVKITTDSGDAVKFAKKAVAEDYDFVVCCGGDGTFNETMTGIITSGKRIPIGYIPAGSTNDFARTLGISTIPKKAAAAAANGSSMLIDAGKFGDDRFFSYIASFGIFTAASYTAQQSAKNVLGHLAYVLEGIRDLGVVKPYNVKVTTKNTVYQGEYIFGAVTNSTSVGGMVKLGKNLVDLNDGMFEVVLVKNPRDVTELSRILVGIANSDLSDSMFEFFKSPEITFEMQEDVSWSLDGEEASPGKKVKIKNLKDAIEIIK